MGDFLGFFASFDPSVLLKYLMGALALGFVIFVHELGHFLVAKACGVKCEKFYVGFDVPIKLGFGKWGIPLPASLFKKQWGETEYGIGIIPLGGYVKMLGQDDNPQAHEKALRQAKDAQAAGKADAETTDDPLLDPRSYLAQSVPERMAIISAGVIMNLIFAVIFAVIAFSIGVDYTPCRLTGTVAGYPAWRAGLLPGDEILEVNGIKNPRLKDLRNEVILTPQGESIPILVKRIGVEEPFELLLQPYRGKDGKQMAGMIGVALAQLPVISGGRPTLPGSPVVGVDLQAGDTVVAINGEKVTDHLRIQELLAQNVDQPMSLVVQRANEEAADGDNASTKEVTLQIAPYAVRRFGMQMAVEPIASVQKDSPAAAAGLQQDDRIIAINDEKFADPFLLGAKLRDLAGETVKVTIDRKGESLDLSVATRQARWLSRADGVELQSLGVLIPVTGIVEDVVEGSPAATEGIQAHDQILAIEILPQGSEEAIEEAKATLSTLRIKLINELDEDASGWASVLEMIQITKPDTKFRVTVQRSGEEKSFDMLPVVSATEFVANRGLAFASVTETMQADSIVEAFGLGFRETKYWMYSVVRFLKSLIRGDISSKALGGPATILYAAGKSAEVGFSELLIFLVMLSANLAVLNFLPIPVLDGGHMVFLIFEGIFRRPVSEKIVIPLTYLGLALILCLMVYVIGLDVFRFLVPWLGG